MSLSQPLLLASSSVFRRQQLARLGWAFDYASPVCDETPLPDEQPQQTALRLAINKARSLAQSFPHHLIIGADQVAWCREKQLGKPMSVDKAKAMLAELSGQRIIFYSAICLLNAQTNRIQHHVDETVVQMRQLSETQIDHYLMREPDAIYCAGAAKSEGLGAILLERVESSDPNALIGLPLFRLVDFLNNESWAV